MHILYVMNSVEGGGAALPVPAIVELLMAQGAQVTVAALTKRDGRAIAAIEATGVRLIVRPGGEKDQAAALAWLDARVAALRPTHLWTSLTRATLLGQIVGLRRRLPVVSWQHAATLKPANRRLLRLQQRLSRLWIGDSSAVTQLTHDRLGVPWSRLLCWPIFRADPSAPRARPWRPGEALRIGSLGRLHPVKGYDVLIEAVARLGPLPAEVRFEIGGEGEERARLDTLVAARGVGARIALPGYVDRPRDWLAGRHLYVQPSRSEGLCVAVHEAMQAGLPVVASAVGELPWSIDAACGRTVPPGDAVALAAALRDLLGAPDRLAAMGGHAHDRLFDRFAPARFEEIGADIVARMRAF